MWVAFALMLYLGIISTYTDIKYGLIKNRDIGITITCALPMQIFFLVQDFDIEIITSILLSFILAYTLWRNNAWSGGDAKLFIAYSLIMPHYLFEYYVPFFYTSVILLYSVVPFGLILSVKAIFKTRKFKFDFSPLIILSAFTASWIARAIGISGWGVIGMIYIVSYIKKIRYGWTLLFGVSVVRLIIDPSVWSISFLIDFFMFTVGFIALKGFLRHIAHDAFTFSAKAREGMVLAQDTKIARKGEVLTVAQAKKLGIVQVSSTLPFAPMMFAGVILIVVQYFV